MLIEYHNDCLHFLIIIILGHISLSGSVVGEQDLDSMRASLPVQRKVCSCSMEQNSNLTANKSLDKGDNRTLFAPSSSGAACNIASSDTQVNPHVCACSRSIEEDKVKRQSQHTVDIKHKQHSQDRKCADACSLSIEEETGKRQSQRTDDIKHKQQSQDRTCTVSVSHLHLETREINHDAQGHLQNPTGFAGVLSAAAPEPHLSITATCRHNAGPNEQINTADSSRRNSGDWDPVLKTLARIVHPKWRTLAEKLQFTAEECNEFEKALPSCDWWASFKMLLSWKAKCQTGKTLTQLKEILADELRPLDGDIADRVLLVTCENQCTT